MNWINMLGPMQWLLLAAIPPAILSLYFLKLKRRELVVPSTMLWKRALEDVHVNSIWQRLRKNLLLYLQLLFMLLIVLACLRPGWSGMNRVGERRIYVIDNSASMQATDVQPSRLEVAKAKVKELLSDASSDDVGMVIAFSDRADVRQGFTNDRRRLLEAVESIQPTSHPTDANEALRAAAGLANPGRTSFEDNKDIQVADAVPATVYLLSDGAIGDLSDSDFGQLKIEYVPIGVEGTSNVGIVGFALERNDEQPTAMETFARIVNSGETHVDCTASLYWNDSLIDAESVSVDGGQEVGLRFELSGVDSGTLKLELDHPDALAMDNVAFAAVRPNRQISVLLVTAGNTALEKAMATPRVSQLATLRVEGREFLSTPEYAAVAADSEFDLIVFDGCAPSKMPASNTLFLGGLPPGDIQPGSQDSLQDKGASKDATIDASNGPVNEANQPEPGVDSKTGAAASGAPSDTEIDGTQWQFGEVQGPAIVLDVNRTNPITQFLEMAAVTIVESRTVVPPSTGSVLMISDLGPVMAIAPRGPYQDAVVGFDMVRPTASGTEMNTDWGIKRSFPVFVYAAVESLGGGVTQASAPSIRPGWPIHLLLSSRSNTYEIRGPSGTKAAIDRGTDGRFLFTQTDLPGPYEVHAEGLDEAVERFCVNLFSQSESNLALGREIGTGTEKIAATDTTIRARQETWRWLLLIGLALLMLEWIVFNKRVFV
jgi:hypothetical protein